MTKVAPNFGVHHSLFPVRYSLFFPYLCRPKLGSESSVRNSDLSQTMGWWPVEKIANRRLLVASFHKLVD